jgi:DNA-binding HxlR family transcriptional regulator
MALRDIVAGGAACARVVVVFPVCINVLLNLVAKQNQLKSKQNGFKMQPLLCRWDLKMSSRKSLNVQPCPVGRSVDLIADRWSLLVVRDAFDGVRRFSDFQRSLGVARNILSDRLRRLVDAGILAIQPPANGGAYQEYVLTERGKALFPVIVALRQWGERNLFEEDEFHSELVEKKTGKPLHFMTPRTIDDRVLSPDETEVRKLF